MIVTILSSVVLLPPPLTTSSLPANVNFDPLNLASKDFTIQGFGKSRSTDSILFDYREAELKHGRLAMLAAIAYPAQELVNPILSKALHLPNELAYEKLSPSLVNGNLQPSILIFFLGLASGLELFKMQQPIMKIPGDYNWRITECEEGTDDFYNLQAGEVWNGRVAMIATLAYVVQEAWTKTPVLFNV